MSFLEYSNPNGQFLPFEDNAGEKAGQGQSFSSFSEEKLAMPQPLSERLTLGSGTGMEDFTDKRTGKRYKHFHMYAEIIIKNVIAESYQIVQTVRMTPGIHGKTNGCKKVDGLEAFVDGGVCSPGVLRGTYDGGEFRKQKVAVQGKPYFLRSSDIQQTIESGGDFDGTDGTGTIILYDGQEAAINHESIVFRSYIIAVNYNKTKKDRVLGLIRWGFGDYGASPSLQNSNLKIVAQNVYDDIDKRIILNDYPNYNI